MSWFKRKPRNRRMGREHVLDVKLRADQIRASRFRLGAVVLGLLFATIFGLFIIWMAGGWALNCLIYQNKAFAIQNIDVETDGVITKAQLRNWAGVKLGQNLFALDLGRVKRDLEMVSVVHSVAVERIMPNTLRLRVVERAPLAQFFVPRLQGTNGFQMAVFRLDEEGCVIAALEPRQRSEPATPADEVYPEIRGGNLNDMAPGKRVDSAQVRAALKLISEFEHSAMAGLVDLQQVDVSSPNVLQVKTTQDCKVTFSALDFDKQFGRWREINDEARKMGKAISTLDLSVPNNIPVLFVDAGTLPPVIPRTKTPQHTRKKNV